MISVKNLTFGYPSSATDIFKDMSFNIDTSWKLGLVGRNGRGKTTLLRLMCGDFDYKGSIVASTNFTYFPYEVQNVEDLTCDVLHDVCPSAQDWQFLKEFRKLNLSEDDFWTPYNTLSYGQQTKALIATLFCADNNFLLIDEPTNHLDMQSRAKVSEYLNSKSGYILVSHDQAFLDGCVDHILSINKKTIEVCSGNFSTWFNNFSAEQEGRLAKNEHLKKDISRLQKSAAQKSNWSDSTESRINGSGFKKGFISHKSAKTMRRSKNIQKNANRQIENKRSLLDNVEEIAALKLNYEPFRAETLISLKNVAATYGNGEVCKPLNLEIKRGYRIALNGTNGSGKSSILKLIIGSKIDYSGQIYSASGLKISYLPQDCSYVSGKLDEFIENSALDKSLFMSVLRKLGFDRSLFSENIESYSLGQKKKVMIAKSLLESANLYVWDEPLNYLDIYCRKQLQQLITEAQPTMLIVEHDKSFVKNVVTDSSLVSKP